MRSLPLALRRRARALAIHALVPTLVAVAVVVPDASAAQTATANVRGYVRGTDNAPVADAQVTARNLETNQLRNTTTNAGGFYYIGGLRPGSHHAPVVAEFHLGHDAQRNSSTDKGPS